MSKGVLEDIVVCLGCQRKLENVMDLLAQFEELQKKIDEKRIDLQNEMINSKEISQAMAESIPGNRMSKSSLDRLTLLKEIGIGNNTLPPAPDHDGIDENSDESSEEEQDPATNDSEDSVGSANARAILPAATMLKNVIICLERVKIPQRVSTVNRGVISNLIPSNSKGGYALRNQKRAAKATIQVEESDSESEPGEDSFSEDATGGQRQSKTSNSSKVPGGGTKSGDNARRARGSIIKEFTRLKNGLYQCKLCSKIITNKSSHVFTHLPKRFKCSFGGCGKLFSFKSNRDNHVKTFHERRRDFKCIRVGCGKLFGKKYNMIMHVNTVHEGRRDFMCPWHGCDKWFGEKGNLTKHIKAVHVRRRFKCKVRGCVRTFVSNQVLLRHMSSTHKKIAVAKKKRMEVTPRSISPPAHARPNLKVEIFECRMDPSCRNVYGLKTERDDHEETHSN